MADGAKRDNTKGDTPPRKPPLDDPVESSAMPSSVPCPFCDSDDTDPFATFGGQASTAQYYCNACRTVFEALRWR
ncbi:MAG: hypothetical protein F4Y74_05375 [Gemmatimonadales bacterium]|nr:hypothetical protein [Gemmatimonadales bacterium]MYG20084.1 hypothetical protein [Gemmatimonadales bacterium]MYH09893.1 hypothetical protein [Gemmatimonadales bacterium]MYL05674.1 hypothetical protein [Gemmatimonadales bacterium]